MTFNHCSSVFCEFFAYTNLVGSGLEGHAGDFSNSLSDLNVETGTGVQAGTDSSAALSEVVQVRQSVLDTLNTVGELLDVAREFLTEGQGSSVLQVSTADLDDILEFIRLGLQGIAKLNKSRKQALVDLHDGSNVHSSGKAEQYRQKNFFLEKR